MSGKCNSSKNNKQSEQCNVMQERLWEKKMEKFMEGWGHGMNSSIVATDEIKVHAGQRLHGIFLYIINGLPNHYIDGGPGTGA